MKTNIFIVGLVERGFTFTDGKSDWACPPELLEQTFEIMGLKAGPFLFVCSSDLDFPEEFGFAPKEMEHLLNTALSKYNITSFREIS